MEKSKMRVVKNGKNVRMTFAQHEEVLEMPNLIEVQKDSYEWFVKKGLAEVLEDVSPIVDYSGKLAIDFIGYSIDNTPKYPVEECKERDVNYAAPLRVEVRIDALLREDLRGGKHQDGK